MTKLEFFVAKLLAPCTDSRLLASRAGPLQSLLPRLTSRESSSSFVPFSTRCESPRHGARSKEFDGLNERAVLERQLDAKLDLLRARVLEHHFARGLAGAHDAHRAAEARDCGHDRL